jgi:UDP-GlcNAc3NAcA epimerase
VIIDGLEAVSLRLPVVLPLHPRTRSVLQREGRLTHLAESMRLIEPVSYLDMVQLEKHAAVIATDSGGVQKEAFFYRVPCVTLRDETEWVELLESGWNRLAPPESADGVRSAVQSAAGTRGADIQPYGSGDAARQIVERLHADLGA